MNFFLYMLKRITLTLAVIAFIIASFFAYLSYKPISFSIHSKLANAIDVNADKATLSFKDFRLQLLLPTASLNKNDIGEVSLNNINICWDLWLLTGDLVAEVNDADLLKLIDKNIAKANNILFNGEIRAKFFLSHLLEIKADLKSNKGWLNNKIPLQDAQISLIYSPSKLLINRFSLRYENDTKLNLNGELKLNNDKIESANFAANINQLPVDYLSLLWPEALFPEVRNWVISNISNGMINQASSKFNFSKKDLEQEILPNDAINGVIEISKVNLKYLDGFSPIKNITGKIKFDGNNLCLEAQNANMLGAMLEKIDLKLPFATMVLSLKAKIYGAINKFAEFIPEKIQQRLTNSKLDFNLIKGAINADVDLIIPINTEFKIQDLQLNVKADLEDVIIDKFELLKLKQGKLNLTNDKDKLSLSFSNKNLISFNLNEYHDQPQQNQIKISANIDIPTKTSLDMIDLNNGVAKFEVTLNHDNWQTRLNLSEAEIYVGPLGYIKSRNQKMMISCDGAMNEVIISSNNCNLQGDELAGSITFAYDPKKNILNKIALTNVKIGKSNFSFTKTTQNNATSYKMTAKAFDMSQLNFSYLSLDKGEANYDLSFDIGRLFCRNDTYLDDFKGYIIKKKNQPIDIKLSTKSANEHLEISKTIKNGTATYILHGAPASLYIKAFGLYKNIRKGDILIEFTPHKQGDNIIYQGKLKLSKFYFTNTSIMSKVILGILAPFNYPIAMAKAFSGGSLLSDSFTADLEYSNKILRLSNGLITGTSYEIKLAGSADISKNNLNFQGVYIPSAFGINKLLSSIPIIGTILSGGKSSAFFGANFSIQGSFDHPKTSFNPLSLLAPGFLKNLVP